MCHLSQVMALTLQVSLRSVLHQLSDVAGSQGWVLGSPVSHKSKGKSECGSCKCSSSC